MSEDHTLIIDKARQVKASISRFPDVSPVDVASVATSLDELGGWEFFRFSQGLGVAYRNGKKHVGNGNGSRLMVNVYFAWRVCSPSYPITPAGRERVDSSFERYVVEAGILEHQRHSSRVVTAILPAPRGMQASLDEYLASLRRKYDA